MIQNDILLRVLRGEKTNRPPVWMMRQAGRYLPEFIALRDKYDFFTRCQTPELATEITLQPIRIIKPDAAILFSDILVVPQAMGVHIEMREGIGPWIESPICSETSIDRLVIPDIYEHLGYVMEAIKMTKEALSGKVPLIGFAGSPWTIMCYLINGQGSKTYDKVKRFCFEFPILAHKLLQKITQVTILYLQEKVKNGCDVIQIFDSWGGVLSPEDYSTFSLEYIRQITNALSSNVPVVVFAKGCWFALEEISKMPVSAVGIDWTCRPKFARGIIGEGVVLQGNFDPARLYTHISEIPKLVKKMIDDFGAHHYIANLGHGILPDVPVDHARVFVESVKSYSA